MKTKKPVKFTVANPEHRFSPEQVDDIITYLLGLRIRLKEPNMGSGGNRHDNRQSSGNLCTNEH